MKQLIYLALASILTLLVLTSLTAACSCVIAKPVIEELNNSASVFLGTVMSVKEGTLSQNVVIEFDVNQSWKGIKSKKITVVTTSSSASCGYFFEEGKTYLVYAHESEGQLSVSLCSRTTDLEYAQSDITELNTLNAGNVTQPSVPTPQQEELSFWGKIAAFFKKLFTND